MNIEAIAAISFLLFAWLVTIFFFVRHVRRLTASKGPSGESALLLGLVTQKAKEAKTAAETLEKIVGLLRLGLIEIGEGGEPTWMNEVAREFFRDEPMQLKSLAELEPGASVTLVLKDRAIDARSIAVEGKRLVVCTDVTESFEMARRLKEQERLALLGQMSGQVAHRIKTPLSVLAGRAQMLARHLPPGSKERLRAESIYDEATDLAREIDEIVRFYRNQEPRLERVDLKELLESVAERLGSMDPDCDIVTDVEDGLMLDTDKALLANALYLVAQNALHPSVEATRIELIARDVVRGRGDGPGEGLEAIEILVRDDGKGIEPQDHEALFNAFWSTRDDGLGLGLFMARDLVERLGGTLEFAGSLCGRVGDEAPGVKGRGPGSKRQGACFRFLIPRRRP